MNRASELDAVNRELYVRNAELAVRNKTLSLLRKIDDVTMTALETGDMTRKIAVILAKEFMYPFVAVAVCDERRHILEWKSVACLDEHMRPCQPAFAWKPLPFTHRTNASVRALHSGKRIIANRLSEALCPSVSEEAVLELQNPGEIKSTLIFPLLAERKQIGVLVIGLNRRAGELSNYEKDTFTPLLNLVTIAIQKAQTYSSLVETTEKLRTANHKLKELDSLKTEFLSIATHQLRTPLAVMKGNAAMLRGGMLGKLSKTQSSAVATVQESTEHLILLVNHLLDLTRIESGRLQVRIESINPIPTIQWVVDFMRPKAQEKQLAVILRTENEIKLKADADKLKEIMMNLMDNAIKYTEKGSVTVIVRPDAEWVLIEVRDTGYGLTSKDHERMFEKFATGSASKYVKTTSGIGLYVCRKLVEAMEGKIEAQSRGKGKGSSFLVRLPIVG